MGSPRAPGSAQGCSAPRPGLDSAHWLLRLEALCIVSFWKSRSCILLTSRYSSVKQVYRDTWVFGSGSPEGFYSLEYVCSPPHGAF